jgi:hypothetical protein
MEAVAGGIRCTSSSNPFYTKCDGSCPTTDSLQRLADYRRSYGIPLNDRLPEWLFCRCPASELDQLRKAFGVYDPDPIADKDRSQHAATLTFGNYRTGRWSALPSGMQVGQLVTTMCRIMGNSEQQSYAIAQRYREAALKTAGTAPAN